MSGWNGDDIGFTSIPRIRIRNKRNPSIEVGNHLSMRSHVVQIRHPQIRMANSRGTCSGASLSPPSAATPQNEISYGRIIWSSYHVDGIKPHTKRYSSREPIIDPRSQNYWTGRRDQLAQLGGCGFVGRGADGTHFQDALKCLGSTTRSRNDEACKMKLV